MLHPLRRGECNASARASRHRAPPLPFCPPCLVCPRPSFQPFRVSPPRPLGSFTYFNYRINRATRLTFVKNENIINNQTCRIRKVHRPIYFKGRESYKKRRRMWICRWSPRQGPFTKCKGQSPTGFF